MSSTYRILCLSHSPALVVDGIELRSSAELVGVLAPDRPAPTGHTGCDLLGGRYCSPLVEVYCPPTPEQRRHYPWHPHSGEWVGVEWLRLLLRAYEATAVDDALRLAVAGIPGCWSRQRVTRLRDELGLKPVGGAS